MSILKAVSPNHIAGTKTPLHYGTGSQTCVCVCDPKVANGM